MERLLAGQRAVIHGGAGAVGSEVARVFVREGADVLLTGRTRSRLDAVAAELGPAGIRVLCVCSDALPEALARGSHTREVFGRAVASAGTTIDAMLEMRARTATLLGRLPTLAEVAETAAFVASSRAGAMTGAVVNLTCGSRCD